MYTSDWKPTQGENCSVAMKSGDWRAQLQRQTIVCKIMDTLKRHLPFSKYERLQELKKIAERVEQEIYTVATTQSEYTRKICFMMLTMETRLQNPMRSKSNAAILYNSVNPSLGSSANGDWQEEVYQQIKSMKDLYLLDSTAQTGNPIGEDVQEEVCQKIKVMKDLYLLDLNAVHQKVISKLQQHDSLPRQPEIELHLEKLKVLKNMLERHMQFLQISKHGIRANHKDKLDTYENQIIIILSADRRRRAAPQPQAQAQALPSPHTQYLQQSEPTHSLTLVQSGGPNIAASLSGCSNAQQNMMNSIQPI